MPLMSPPLAPDRVRLREVPALDPPYLDGLAPDPLAAAQPPLLAPRRPDRRWPAAGTGSGDAAGGDPVPPLRGATADPGPVPPPPAAPPLVVTPSTRFAAVRFVQTVMEIFNGYRPPSHAWRLATPTAAPAVHQEMVDAMRRLGRRSADGRPGRLTVRRMRVCEPRPGVAEISLVLATVDDRGHPGASPARATATRAGDPTAVHGQAAAFRIEKLPGGWRCTAARIL